MDREYVVVPPDFLFRTECALVKDHVPVDVYLLFHSVLSVCRPMFGLCYIHRRDGSGIEMRYQLL